MAEGRAEHEERAEEAENGDNDNVMVRGARGLTKRGLFLFAVRWLVAAKTFQEYGEVRSSTFSGIANHLFFSIVHFHSCLFFFFLVYDLRFPSPTVLRSITIMEVTGERCQEL